MAKHQRKLAVFGFCLGAAIMAIVFSRCVFLPEAIPQALETIVADDGSIWERVNLPGFGNSANVGIVALTPYRGSLYALTRNDASGFELWQTLGSGWKRVTVAGFTDQHNAFGYLKPGPANTTDAKYNLRQNIWGDMIAFKDFLYVAVSSGYQGASLYGSTGLAIWRFNGITWHSVIAASVDKDESGTIAQISSCDDDDGDATAQFSDPRKSWATDQWAGCVLQVPAAFDGTDGTEAGTPGIRLFEITANTPDTLTVRQDEDGLSEEFTVCAQHSIQGEAGRPNHVVPAIEAAAAYTIQCGVDERGFGEIWNKSIIDFEILNDELYASIGLNYVAGAAIWKTSDGVNWVATSEKSFGLFHGYDPQGQPTAECLIPGLESRNGLPVSSSVTNFGKSAVTGTETLFTGGTGTSGCNGRGARVARLDGDAWTLIVDHFVDANTTGTNENGLGAATSFLLSNFQAWSWAEYDGLLFVGIVRLQGGSRVMYTASGSADDGAWVYAVGGDSTAMPDGFGEQKTIGSHLYVFNDRLYAGNLEDPNNGADIWQATGPGTDLTWTRITGDGFGDASILQFEAFTTFSGKLYVAASNVRASNWPGEEEPGASGAKVYRLQ